LKHSTSAASIPSVTAIQDYLKRAEEVEARAARCVSGSLEEREFLHLAEQWRGMAKRQEGGTRFRGPD
jgi:hypothetical protein